MAYYLKYLLKNEEPVRIADDSIAQKGQTGTLHYIPGSAMRGFVLTKLSKDGFGDEKEALFTKISFMNAYPVSGQDWLIPAPKGFYEDKSETNDKKFLENVVVDGKAAEGLKRARLGEFCNVKNGCIEFYTIRSKGELKKQMYGDAMFRNEYIDRGYTFGGAIVSENRELLNRIAKLIEGEVYLGTGRSSGMGRCSVLKIDIDQQHPYKSYSTDEDLTGDCYLMLLSPTSMRNENGEPVGINVDALQNLLGIVNLKIKYCSTSTKKIQGYNRTWHGSVPSVMMYDKGSIFHMTYSGTLSAAKISEVMDTGLGERIYDGFGRVIILKDYGTWNSKTKGSELCSRTTSKESERTDKSTLYVVARKYYRRIIEEAMDRYIVEHPLKKGMLKSSKTRGIEPILTMNRFNYKNAVELLYKYFEHEADKEKAQKIHKELSNTQSIGDHVFAVLDGDIENLLSVKTGNSSSVMTIPKEQLLSEEEVGELKLLFLLKELRFDSRKGANG